MNSAGSFYCFDEGMICLIEKKLMLKFIEHFICRTFLPGSNDAIEVIEKWNLQLTVVVVMRLEKKKKEHFISGNRCCSWRPIVVQKEMQFSKFGVLAFFFLLGLSSLMTFTNARRLLRYLFFNGPER
ncbi:hypothetical protein T4B_5804 [Trichinella pseudospiralis]|uniref:Transmembrane protein n=1 Tax=Trichinella pseudospiralis TaxID=6337 RepID=A0A0V1HQE5_TRIPS|nr:hypothetical protein T4B_5804 [Trichinella pseudospiralis]